MAHTAGSDELVRTILAMARGLRMGVIAEGVETAQHVSILKDMGCEFAQGYLFSRPVCAPAMDAFLRAGGIIPAVEKAQPASPEAPSSTELQAVGPGVER